VVRQDAKNAAKSVQAVRISLFKGSFSIYLSIGNTEDEEEEEEEESNDRLKKKSKKQQSKKRSGKSKHHN
jgi:hypothetical protein